MLIGVAGGPSGRPVHVHDPEPGEAPAVTGPERAVAGSAVLLPGLRLTWAGGTHVGLVRESNQDAYLAGPPVFAVADGLGGHAGGEVASALAVQAFERLGLDPAIDADAVARASAEASAAMAADALDHPDRAGMATTLSAVVLAGLPEQPHLLVVNVGDSRVYRLRGGELVQMTMDHSEVQELLNRGLIDREAAARYPRRNVVTRVLAEYVDRSPDVRPVSFELGDRYLLCTDGLHGAVSEELLSQILATGSDLESIVGAMLRSALANGGYDNITAIVLDVTGDQECG